MIPRVHLRTVYGSTYKLSNYHIMNVSNSLAPLASKSQAVPPASLIKKQVDSCQLSGAKWSCLPSAIFGNETTLQGTRRRSQSSDLRLIDLKKQWSIVVAGTAQSWSIHAEHWSSSVSSLLGHSSSFSTAWTAIQRR